MMLGLVLKAFEDHYWDSLEPNKDLVMLHIKAVLSMLQPLSESDDPPQSGRTAMAQREEGEVNKQYQLSNMEPD